MKVLFVSSGNIKKFGISPIVTNQGDSLKKAGVDVIYYGIEGKGKFNYLKNIKSLRRFIKESHADIIHAHYSLSAIVAAIANTNKPMVVSLMGSDSQAKFFFRWIIKIFYSFFWKVTIVKSQNIKDNLSMRNALILPNGVDFNLFRPLDKTESKKKVNFLPDKKYVVFIADPAREEKNVKLAKESVDSLKTEKNVELFVVFGENGIDNKEIPDYLNAADALILTSLSEGSPNVVKEAMACNCPVVSTDVGDVRSVIGNTAGCYVTSYDAKDIASKLLKAIDHGKTTGRKDIEHLDSEKIAEKLIYIYSGIIKK